MMHGMMNNKFDFLLFLIDFEDFNKIFKFGRKLGGKLF